MFKRLFVEKRFALKWLGIAFLIKGALFVLFTILFNQNWPNEQIINHLFVISGDTGGYYEPVESFVRSGNYDTYCRMPGLLPIYAPLYFLFGSVWGKTLVIVLQFLAGVVATYLLSETATMVFKNKKIFYYTFFLYAFSSFVSIWDHYGYSDSFGVSFLIYAVYFALRFRNTKGIKNIWLSGIFVAWSIFFRPVHGVLFPLIGLLYLVQLSNLALTFRNLTIFTLPLLGAISVWTFSNYSKYQKLVLLQGPTSDCFGSLTPELLSIRALIIGWGGDYQPWSKGSEAEWFFDKKAIEPDRNVIPENYLAKTFNYDSLLLLRNQYRDFISDGGAENKSKLSESIIKKSTAYATAYKNENTFKYYFTNRLKILKQLLFPKRLDNFPTPALKDMNLFHKSLKAFYFLFFLFISLSGLFGCFWQLFNKNYFSLIPLTTLTMIGCILGYVEQRYLCPIYPYFVIFSSAVLVFLIDLFLIKKMPGDKTH